jgi:hypothetical protein
MKKQLTYITPLQAGIVLGFLYGFIALIIAPFALLVALFAKDASGAHVVFAVCLPVLYGFVGFISGIIVTALYNLITKWTGGIEFEVRDATPPVV